MSSAVVTKELGQGIHGGCGGGHFLVDDIVMPGCVGRVLALALLLPDLVELEPEILDHSHCPLLAGVGLTLG